MSYYHHTFQSVGCYLNAVEPARIEERHEEVAHGTGLKKPVKFNDFW
jgi:hypothetical protein